MSSKAKIEAVRDPALRLADRVIGLARKARPPRPASKAERRRARLMRPMALTARDTEIEPVERKVDDPYEAGSQITTTFNRRVDILENERACRRIKESEYLVGRIVQAVFERASGSLGGGGWSPGDRVDADAAKELSIIRAITDARAIRAMSDRITRELGPFDARILSQVLGERRSFSDLAALRGRVGRQGTSYYADRFRDALEALDAAFAARGRMTMVDVTIKEANPENPASPVRSLIRASQIRGERVERRPDEDYDVNGIAVPVGKGFRVADDEDRSQRWQPRSKKSRAQVEGEAVTAERSRHEAR